MLVGLRVPSAMPDHSRLLSVAHPVRELNRDLCDVISGGELAGIDNILVDRTSPGRCVDHEHRPFEHFGQLKFLHCRDDVLVSTISSAPCCGEYQSDCKPSLALEPREINKPTQVTTASGDAPTQTSPSAMAFDSRTAPAKIPFAISEVSLTRRARYTSARTP